MCYSNAMRIPTGPARASIEVKKSRFIAIAQPVAAPEEVRTLIAQTRKEHPQANHVVHAAVIGEQGAQFSVSDDHEPKNTAGRPVLEVLKGSGITNVIVMVVRYFGGTLLGTGGLVKAYQEAAKSVINILETEELVRKKDLTIVADYDSYDHIKQLLTDSQCRTTEEFATRVTIVATVEERMVDEVAAAIVEITHGRAEVSHSQDGLGKSFSP